MKPASAMTKSDNQALLYAAAAAFFAMILLAPMMIISEASAGRVSYTGEGSSLRQIGYVLILGLSIVGAIKQGNGARALVMPWPILVALGWCWVSLTWAINEDIAIRRLVLTTIAVWNTFIIIQAAGYERTMTVLRAGFVLLLVANYVTVFAVPHIGVHLMVESDINTALVGNWRGLMGHKNVAGATAALTILLFLFDAKQIKSSVRIIVTLAAVYFLFRSQSKTSGGMLVIASVCGWVFQRYDDKIRALAVSLIMFVTAIVWFLYNTYSKFVFENYLNPTFFTGRGWIWSAMFRYSADTPLGAGFGSFWNVGSDTPILKYGQGWVRDVATGHNGYLDLMVTIGIPGVLIVIFAVIIWPTWKLLVSRITPERGAMAVALLLFCMGHNITESSLLERDALIGVMMMIVVAIAQNWEQMSVAPRKRIGGLDVFAALAKRQRHEAA